MTLPLNKIKSFLHKDTLSQVWILGQWFWIRFLKFFNVFLCSPNEVGEHIDFTLFLVIIIKVFRFTRKTVQRWYLFFFFFYLFLSAGFVREHWMNLLEIFRVDVKLNEVVFLLSKKSSLPVGKYGRFSFFFLKRSCA